MDVSKQAPIQAAPPPMTTDNDELSMPEKPQPIETDDSKPSQFLGEFSANAIRSKPQPGRPPFQGITHLGD